MDKSQEQRQADPRDAHAGGSLNAETGGIEGATATGAPEPDYRLGHVFDDGSEAVASAESEEPDNDGANGDDEAETADVSEDDGRDG